MKMKREPAVERPSTWGLIRAILPYASRERKWYAAAIVLLPLASLIPVTLPRIVQEIVDNRLPYGVTRGLLFFVALLAAMVLLDALVQTIFTFLLRSIGLRIMKNLRHDLFVHVEKLPLTFFRRESRGRIVARLTTDLEQIDQMFATGGVMLISDFVAFVVTGIAMITFAPRLGLGVLTVFPFVAGTVMWLSLRLRQILRESKRLTARMNGFAQEALSAHDVISILGAQGEFFRRFDSISHEYELTVRRSNRYEAAFFASIDFFSSIAIAVLVVAATGASGVTVGVLIAMTQYVQQFFAPLRGLSSRYATFQQAMVALERVHALRSEPVEPNYGSPTEAVRRSGDPQSLAIKDLRFSYRSGEEVLRGVDITIHPEEHVALFGETGTGKSTLARIIPGFYSPDAGQLHWGEDPLNEFTLFERRNLVALAPQEVFLFDASIEENVLLGKHVTPEKWNEIAGAVGLDLITTRAGRETGLGEWGRRLSEGEKQLIAAARVLAYDPAMVVLDEATSSLDPLLEARVQAAMKSALQGRSALIIAHRPSTLEAADRVAVMHEGVIVEQGNHEELYRANGRYRRLRELIEMMRVSGAEGAEQI